MSLPSLIRMVSWSEPASSVPCAPKPMSLLSVMTKRSLPPPPRPTPRELWPSRELVRKNVSLPASPLTVAPYGVLKKDPPTSVELRTRESLPSPPLTVASP